MDLASLLSKVQCYPIEMHDLSQGIIRRYRSEVNSLRDELEGEGGEGGVADEHEMMTKQVDILVEPSSTVLVDRAREAWQTSTR